MADHQAFTTIMILASAGTVAFALRREWSALAFLGIALIAVSRI